METVKRERRSKFRTQYKIIEVTEESGNLNGMYFELYMRHWTTFFCWWPSPGRWNFEVKEDAIARVQELNAKHIVKRKEVWRE